MNVTIITMLVHFFTIGVASASRIKGGMRTLIEGPKERNLEDPALSMPPQPIDDHNHDIKELLANEGFDAGAISHITTALDLSGARMTSGSDAKYWCASILEELFDFLLFSAAVEDAITLLICNREDEGTTTSPVVGMVDLVKKMKTVAAMLTKRAAAAADTVLASNCLNQ